MEQEQTPSTFIPKPSPKLEQRLAALQKACADKPDDKRLNARIEKVTDAITEDAKRQEQAYNRANGLLPKPRVFGYRFTPSTSTPIICPKRQLRRDVEKLTGHLSGRQWRKLRRQRGVA